MRIDCSRYGIECIKARISYIVVPFGQFGISNTFILCQRKDQAKRVSQAKGFIDVGVLCKQDSYFLLNDPHSFHQKGCIHGSGNAFSQQVIKL